MGFQPLARSWGILIQEQRITVIQKILLLARRGARRAWAGYARLGAVRRRQLASELVGRDDYLH